MTAAVCESTIIGAGYKTRFYAAWLARLLVSVVLGTVVAVYALCTHCVHSYHCPEKEWKDVTIYR